MKDMTIAEHSKYRTLSWMASLSVAAGEAKAAEGYLLELLACCAFDRTIDRTTILGLN